MSRIINFEVTICLKDKLTKPEKIKKINNILSKLMSDNDIKYISINSHHGQFFTGDDDFEIEKKN